MLCFIYFLIIGVKTFEIRSWLYGGQNSNFEVVHLGTPSLFYKFFMEKRNENKNFEKIKFRNCWEFFIKSATYP